MKLGLPDLDQAKSAVLNSLRSPESERGYQHSDEFIGWYCSESRFTPLREHFRGRADGSCDTSNGTSIPSPSSVLPAWSSPCLEGEEAQRVAASRSTSRPATMRHIWSWQVHPFSVSSLVVDRVAGK